MYLEDEGLLDMNDTIHRVCLYHVFEPRIQAALDRVCEGWNTHQIRTARNQTPLALFELSREEALQAGRWTGDPGDDIETASNSLYGVDGEAPLPPVDEAGIDPSSGREDWGTNEDTEREQGVRMNGEGELEKGLHFLEGFDLMHNDGNWGIDIYCETVTHFVN